MTTKLSRIFYTLLLSCISLSLWADDLLFNNSKNAASLSKAMKEIEFRYVEEVNSDTLTEIAIKAMLKELDPHSSYLTPKELKLMQENLGGSFEGIGVSYQMVNDTLLVIRTIEGGPSEKAGIHPTDQIVTVDDSIIAGRKLDNEQIKQALRGPHGTKVRLGILRANEKDLRYIDVKRDKIPVYCANVYYMLNDHVGYIKIDRFGQNTTNEVKSAIEALVAEGMEDLVIDLQGNGGGYLNAAVDLAALFLPNNVMVVYTKGRTENSTEYYTRTLSPIFRGRVVVLTDEASASASEIFAGAMQDYDRGIIVGRLSFGKGLVQKPIELHNGGLIRLTVSHYYTPSGRCIQKPYVKGKQQEYQQDINNRFKNGELTSADSIHVTDTTRYFTQHGRMVYGGGGIMPDVFVALDTTRMTPAHRALSSRGIISRYMLKYFRQNRKALIMQFPTIQDFNDSTSGFYLNDDVVSGLIDQAKQDSVKVEGLDELMGNEVFRLQCMAYLANDLYDNGAYNQVMLPVSAIIREAMAVLEDKRYEKCLLSPTIYSQNNTNSQQ